MPGLIAQLRERDLIVRRHHEMRTGRVQPSPMTFEGMAADEIERLQAEVLALRASLGHVTGVEPVGCPTPGACSCPASK